MNELAQSQLHAGNALTTAMASPARITRADWLLPLLIATPLLIALQVFGGDQAIMDRIYDANAQRFPLHRDWLLSVALHEWLRWPVIALGVLSAVALLMTSLAQRRPKPQQREQRPFAEQQRDRPPLLLMRVAQQQRATLVFALVAMFACTVLIATIKHFSIPACPYRLTMYGGAWPRLGVFDPLPAGVHAGHCWPGGHVSTAFALFCWYFIARRQCRAWTARAVLMGILAFGAVLTTAQVLRGTHWPSDQIWTALLCWYITLGVLAAFNLYLRRGRWPVPW